MNNNQIPKINQFFPNYFSMPCIPNQSFQFITQQNQTPMPLSIGYNYYSPQNSQNPLLNFLFSNQFLYINPLNISQRILIPPQQNMLNELNQLILSQKLLNENIFNNSRQLNEQIINDNNKENMHENNIYNNNYNKNTKDSDIEKGIKEDYITNYNQQLNKFETIQENNKLENKINFLYIGDDKNKISENNNIDFNILNNKNINDIINKNE